MTQIRDTLKFVSIQTAAEAFLEGSVNNPLGLGDALKEGNGHATRFPNVLADRFANDYTVVAHRPNTTTGFSGTLFRNNTTNELILSFRSTEFVDDSLRDAKATGELEIARLGWAIGQISDMEDFYAGLKATTKIKPTDVFYVTGYSLGGHLATAFNLLRQEAGEAERIVHTYTFNGAGTGGLLGGAQLQAILADFKDWRQNPSHIAWSRFSPSQRQEIERNAASRVSEIFAEEARLDSLKDVKFNPPVRELANLVAAKDLNYQIALLAATSRRTTPSSGLPFRVRGENIVPSSPAFASSRIPNMTEIVGIDAGNLGPSFIANSGLHYGERQTVYIEDQPLYRGNFSIWDAVARRNLLQNTYPKSGFGDTHSIVLLVDSLTVMDVFARLAKKDSGLTQQHIEKIFAASSRSGAAATYGTQGKAEGDTLENALDSLRRLIVGADSSSTGTADDLSGGTWHALEARNRFHQNVEVLKAQIDLSDLAGKLTFTVAPDRSALIAGANLAGDEGAAWRYALVHLNPFVVHGDSTLLPQYALEKYARSDAGHPDGLTDAYIRDRAAFLSWKNEDFQANGQRTLRGAHRETFTYADNATDLKLTVQGPMYSPNARRVNVVFGNDTAEIIAEGPAAVDHLYGGGGDDVLGGGSGNDYLEGNAGDDTLDGGTGADTLAGGSGDDTLRGGTEIDTYVVGAGNDHVIDEDGRGMLVDAHGNRIDGLFVKKGSQYVLATHPEITATTGDTLEITLANGATVAVHDFTDGDLGLRLTKPHAEVPAEQAIELTPEDDWHIVISTKPTVVRGLAGNDFIAVEYIDGNMRAEGGAGGDAIGGSIQDDRLFGGTQADLEPLVNGALSGNSDREALNGSDGNDLVVGGDSSDWLVGGAGDDEIYAGAGDDLIAGGGDLYGNGFYWEPQPPGTPTPIRQDTLIFNVDMGGQSLSDEAAAYLRASGRVARGEFLELRYLDEQDGSDTIIAGAGDDEVWAGWGSDYVSGDAGADTLFGEEGGDTLFGGADADTIHGDGAQAFGGPDNHGADYIDGEDGDDKIWGWGSEDTIFGGKGDDLLVGDEGSLDSAYHGNDYLDGEEGDDDLSGQGGDDQLFGGHGRDELKGGDGEDYLDGEGGADTAFGGVGDDELYGGSGDDRLLGESGADVIDGEEGIDTLYGDTGADTLRGGGGGDTLYGDADADGLYGGQGDDRLEGGEGDDLLSGGAGNDMLVGGAGDDVYSFAAGDGVDTVVDTEGTTTLRFTGAGSATELKIVQSTSGEARIQHGVTGDGIVLPTGLDSVQQFEFATGSVKTVKEVLDLADADPVVLTGADFGASIYGGTNNDTLTAAAFGRVDGGRGDDTLTSAGEFATFEFSAGDGHDLVRGEGDLHFEFDESVSRSDLVAFRMDPLDPEALTPRDLILQYGPVDNPATIKVEDNVRSPFRRYQFVDGSMSHSELLERSGLGLHWRGSDEDETVAGTRNADQLAGEAGRDTLDGGGGDDVLDGGAAADVLRGGAGSDTLFGGRGNDTLEGGAGDDRYVVQVGDGADVLVDGAGHNRIDFGPGISLSDIDAALVSGNDGNLYLAVRSSPTDTVLIRQNFGDAAGDGTFTFRFADGTELTSAELSGRTFDAPLDFRGASEALRLSGSEFDDVVIGSTRDDRIEGGGGNDRLAGDAGSDVLSGGAGDDFLVGNSGDDVLEGGAGRDMYRFHRGMGRDLILEAGEQNTLLFDADIARADLAFERSGNDLYVHFANARDGVRIRDYFVPAEQSEVQSWQVRFGEAPATTLASLAGVIEEVTPPATIEAMMADFSLRARTHYESLLVAEGYQRQGDGTLAKEEVRSGDYYSSHTVTTVGFASRESFDDSGWIWSDVVSLDVMRSSWATSSAEHTFQRLDTMGSTYVPLGAGRNIASGGRVVVFGGDPDDISTNNDEDTAVYMPGELVEASPFSGTSMTNPVGGGSFSFGRLTPQYTTQTVIRTHSEETYEYRVTLGALKAGQSDNEIHVQPFTIVDGGAGDDRLTVNGAIFLPQYRLADIAGAPGAFLLGNTGNDTITGGECDDVLIGGRDNDTLIGGKGNDLYVLLPGDGFDEIIEDGATIPGVVRENVLRLPEGVTAENLTQALTHELAASPHATDPSSPDAVKSMYAFLTLTWGGTDGVRLTLPHAEAGAAYGIDYVEFADGSRIALPDLVARVGGELDPYSAANNLTGEGIVDGGPGDDVIHASRPVGGAGRDTLIGTEGDDELFGGDFHRRVLVSSARFGTMWDEGNAYHGGAGDDRIWATAGTDTFEFELGDGCDTISDVQHDSLYLSYGGSLDRLAPHLDAAANEPAHREALLSNTDTIRFGAGIAPGDIAVVRSGSSRDSSGRSDALVFQHRNGTDAIRFANWYQLDHSGRPIHNQLAQVVFAGGTSWDRHTIEALAASAPREIPQSDGDDYMFGTRFDEVLRGGEGNDWLQAGEGNDVLDGGEGDDVYFFEPGDGIDVVRESGTGTFDVLQFGDSITSGDISLGLGSLLIRIGSTGEAIHIEGFDPAQSLASGTIERFDFYDGTSFSYAGLLARGFDLDGTSADDVLTGTDVNDRMRGFFGNDSISAGAGDDTLDGGGGDDTLRGGEGSDVYRFGAGSGSDHISDSGGTLDAIQLGTGIDPDTVRVTRAGNTLKLSFAGLPDTLSIEQEGIDSIEQVEFSNGVVWDAATLLSKVEVGTVAPILSLPIPDQVTDEDALFAFRLPDATFAPSGQTFTLSASLEDGSTLPEWLTFDPVTHTLRGTPGNEHVGEIDVTVTASAGEAGVASDTFRISVANTNDRPLTIEDIADQWAQEDVAFNFTVPAGTFFDRDADDMLTLHATLPNGKALPEWVHFDALKGTLSGTPGNGDVGAVPVRITATDLDGEQAWTDLTLNVINVNDTPVLQNALPDLRTVERQPFGFTVPARTFSDLDVDDALLYHATRPDGGPLPAWLTFDPQTRTFAGTPGEDDIGVHQIRVSAFDASGSSASDDLTLEVTVLPGRNIIGTARADTLSGTAGADALHGLAGNDTLSGQAGRDVMSGGAGNDRLDGGSGDDWLFGGTGNDTLGGGAGRDRLWGGEGNDALTGEAGGDVLYGQEGNDKLSGGAGQDVLEGGRGNDELCGDAGEDYLRGGADNDTLGGGASNDLLEGGAGNDTVDAGEGNDFIAGGAGADVIKSGDGHDIIAFNCGDGADTIQAGTGAEDTLSLGGGVRSAELSLARSGHDLVLNVGRGDRITFRDWYANKPSRSIAKLQVISDARPDCGVRDADPLFDDAVQTFDFQELTAAFDAARAANPKLQSWAVAPALPGTRGSHSEAEAIGGVIAQEYAMRGDLDRLDPAAAFEILARPSFGVQPETLVGSQAEAPQSPDATSWKHPGGCNGDPVRRLASDFREGAFDAWADKLEDAIERWLDRTGVDDDAHHKSRDGADRASKVAVDLAAAWQRTRDLLEAHLDRSRGAIDPDADGAVFTPRPELLGAGRFSNDTLGRVSGVSLRPLNGLEEGLKALAV